RAERRRAVLLLDAVVLAGTHADAAVGLPGVPVGLAHRLAAHRHDEHRLRVPLAGREAPGPHRAHDPARHQADAGASGRDRALRHSRFHVNTLLGLYLPLMFSGTVIVETN